MMSSLAGAAGEARFDEQALRRGVASVKHPLTRALLVLTFTTGLIDAVSYLALGRVFTANMTGNVVLLGFGIAEAARLPVVRRCLARRLSARRRDRRDCSRNAFADRHPSACGAALAVEAAPLALQPRSSPAWLTTSRQAAAYALIVLMASGWACATRRPAGSPCRTSRPPC